MQLGDYNKYKARVAEDVVEMKELWLWNDEEEDYQVVTLAAPGIVIYDRPGKHLFLMQVLIVLITSLCDKNIIKI
jgi:hypothetical protein